MDDLNEPGEHGVQIEELVVGSDRSLADQVAARCSAVLPTDQAALVSEAVHRAVARATGKS
jgi:hypothetical protein